MKKKSRRQASWTWSAMLSLALVAAGPALAEKGGNGGGKGGGGNGGGGDTGGDPTPVVVTFADELGASGYRISGDGLGAYAHDPAASGVEAYLGGGGASGDLFLRLANAPGRGLYLDFNGCHGSCSPPVETFGEGASGVDLVSSISLAPGDVGIKDGLWGIAPGESAVVPMHMYYDFDNPSGPGQIYFDSALKGRNPCKNKSLYVTVTRAAAGDAWTVSADATALACATLPGGSLSGQYELPFQLTVEPLP